MECKKANWPAIPVPLFPLCKIIDLNSWNLALISSGFDFTWSGILLFALWTSILLCGLAWNPSPYLAFLICCFYYILHVNKWRLFLSLAWVKNGIVWCCRDGVGNHWLWSVFTKLVIIYQYKDLNFSENFK